jgi:hypothetical protein
MKNKSNLAIGILNGILTIYSVILSFNSVSTQYFIWIAVAILNSIATFLNIRVFMNSNNILKSKKEDI